MSGIAQYVPPTFAVSSARPVPQADLGWSAGRPPVEPRVTIGDIARALWRRKLRIGLFTVVLMAPVTYVIMNLPVSYTAAGHAGAADQFAHQRTTSAASRCRSSHPSRTR